MRQFIGWQFQSLPLDGAANASHQRVKQPSVKKRNFMNTNSCCASLRNSGVRRSLEQLIQGIGGGGGGDGGERV